MEKKEKPFHGYNKKKHARTGGLNDKERKRINREEGRDLKRPQPEGGPRKRSFCARFKGMKGATSKDGKLTPKGAAMKRWKCSKSEETEKQYDPYWLNFGTKIEMEHTDDKAIAQKIAKDHLNEHPLYYKMLQIMEQYLKELK